jgi:hypothetical protein
MSDIETLPPAPLPYAFARRFGVVLQPGADGRHMVALRQDADPLVLLEVRRYLAQSFGDIEARHHLDAADDDRRDVRGHAQGLAQNTVDAHPDDEPALIGFDVDVGHALPNRLGNDAVDQADGGGVVGGIEQILGARDAAGQRVDFLRAHRHRRSLAIGHIMV